MPSWIKQFEYSELLYVWRLASEALAQADEIIIIGYSLPKEDTATTSLFCTIKYKCSKLIIIDPFAEELTDKYHFFTKIKNIEYINKRIEDFLTKFDIGNK